MVELVERTVKHQTFYLFAFDGAKMIAYADLKTDAFEHGITGFGKVKPNCTKKEPVLWIINVKYRFR